MRGRPYMCTVPEVNHAAHGRLASIHCSRSAPKAQRFANGAISRTPASLGMEVQNTQKSGESCLLVITAQPDAPGSICNRLVERHGLSPEGDAWTQPCVPLLLPFNECVERDGDRVCR